MDHDVGAVAEQAVAAAAPGLDPAERKLMADRAIAGAFTAEWMPVQAAARLVGCSRQAIYERIRRGVMPTQKIGAVRYVRMTEVVAMQAKARDMAEHPEKHVGRGRGGFFRAAYVKFRARLGDPLAPGEVPYARHADKASRHAVERARAAKRKVLRGAKGKPGRRGGGAQGRPPETAASA